MGVCHGPGRTGAIRALKFITITGTRVTARVFRLGTCAVCLFCGSRSWTVQDKSHQGAEVHTHNWNASLRSVPFKVRLFCGSLPWTVQDRGHQGAEVHNHNGNVSGDHAQNFRARYYSRFVCSAENKRLWTVPFRTSDFTHCDRSSAKEIDFRM